MKVSRNMLMEMAMEIYEEHTGIRIKRPAVMLEFRRRAKHLSPQQRQLLKEGLRNHMLREGFLDKIGNFFSGAKNAVTSFVDGFKDAPKRFKDLRPIVKKDSQRFYINLTDICPIEWEPIHNYMLAFTMVKSCMSDSMKGLKTRYASYRKMCSQEIADLVNGGTVDALFGGFESLNLNDIDDAVKALQDDDIVENEGLAFKS